MTTQTQLKTQMLITFYGYGNGRKFMEHFVSTDLEKVLDELDKALGAESAVATLYDGRREKSFCHWNELFLRVGHPESRAQNKERLEKALAEPVRTAKTGWNKLSEEFAFAHKFSSNNS
jgi:hypothetical protein